MVQPAKQSFRAKRPVDLKLVSTAAANPEVFLQGEVSLVARLNNYRLYKLFLILQDTVNISVMTASNCLSSTSGKKNVLTCMGI